MPNFCSNGHQMEDDWQECLYCQRTRSRLTVGLEAQQRTRLENGPEFGSSALGLGGGLVPTVLESSKTVLLSAIQKPAVVGWLVAVDGQHAGEDYRLRDGQNVIGSAAGVDVHLPDAGISGRHATVRLREGKFTMTDLDSTNGTFLNGGTERVERETLKDNDVVRFGGTSFRFKVL